jgi:hypothetical protein
MRYGYLKIGREVQSQKIKSLEHMVTCGWQVFRPCTNNILSMYDGLVTTIFSS